MDRVGMCLSPVPPEQPEPEPSWLPRTPLAEPLWEPLLRACLNRVTPTNCTALVAALQAAVAPRAVCSDTVSRLVDALLSQVLVSSVWGRQHAAVCAALADLRPPDESEPCLLELVVARCQAAALGQVDASAAERRHCAAFLGELHAAGLTAPERLQCWLQLLVPSLQEVPLPAAAAAGVDSLCALLTAAGGAADGPALTPVWQRLEELATAAGLDTRLRCLLLDVLELRQRGWRPRAHVTRPQPLQELRADAAATATPQTRRRRRRRRH